MQESLQDVLKKFGALSQETRLKTLRYLVGNAPIPVPAGEIADKMGVPQNTMSSHLSVLVAAGLLSCERSGRRLLYSADLSGVRSLMTFLVQDCCQGNPEQCSSLLNLMLPTET